MMYVFLIGNEHQLMQVDIAIKHFKIKSEEVVLLIQEISSNNSLSNLVKLNNNYGTVYNFKNWTAIDLIKFRKKPIFFIEVCKELKALNNQIVFFASHYSDDSTFLFLSILNPHKFYLMDEGTTTYLVLKWRETFELFLKIKLFLKSLRYGILLKRPDCIIFFSRFNFTPGAKDKKELYIVPKVENYVTQNIDQFAFLGSSVVELNMMNEEDYLFYLNKVAFQNSNKQLLYFKHRKEDEGKLKKIEKIGFQIMEINKPFEKYFAMQKAIPGSLGSFFTTSVLINISEIYENIPQLKIFIFPMNKLKKDRVVFGNILEYLTSDKNLNFVSLD